MRFSLRHDSTMIDITENEIFNNLADVLKKIPPSAHVFFQNIFKLNLKQSIEVLSSGTTSQPHKSLLNPESSKLSSIKKNFTSSPQSTKTWLCGFSFSSYGAIKVASLCIQKNIDFIFIDYEHANYTLDQNYTEFYLSTTPSLIKLIQLNEKIQPLVRKIYLSGELVSNLDFEHAKRLYPNACVYQIYGTSESGQLAISDSYDFAPEQLTSSSLRITNDGEIEYLKHNNWVRTGDIIKKNESGRYQFIGRSDFSFKVGTNWIYPEYIETIFESHSLIKRALIYPRSVPLLGFATEATIEMSSQAIALPEVKILQILENDLRPKFQNFQWPVRFNFNKVILTESGKKKRY